jgi:hypothetical protein
MTEALALEGLAIRDFRDVHMAWEKTANTSASSTIDTFIVTRSHVISLQLGIYHRLLVVGDVILGECNFSATMPDSSPKDDGDANSPNPLMSRNHTRVSAPRRRTSAPNEACGCARQRLPAPPTHRAGSCLAASMASLPCTVCTLYNSAETLQLIAHYPVP